MYFLFSFHRLARGPDPTQLQENLGPRVHDRRHVFTSLSLLPASASEYSHERRSKWRFDRRVRGGGSMGSVNDIVTIFASNADRREVRGSMSVIYPFMHGSPAECWRCTEGENDAGGGDHHSTHVLP